MSTLIGTRKIELKNLETIRFVTSALFEVSAEKIARLRAAFKKNSTFYTEISDLYKSVKQAAFIRGQLPKKTAGSIRKISVAFTSNSRFYGSVNTDVMNSFIKHMNDKHSDYVVIGRMGESFMRSFPEFEKRASYMSFEGDEPKTEEIRAFLKKVTTYNSVYIFHSSFINVFNQKVSILDIAHTPLSNSTNDTGENIDYIFEPELPKILTFFETRVRHLLFQRIMLESELARTAARLIAMNKAENKADEVIESVQHLIKHDISTFNDSRLLEAFSAISKWKK